MRALISVAALVLLVSACSSTVDGTATGQSAPPTSSSTTTTSISTSSRPARPADAIEFPAVLTVVPVGQPASATPTITPTVTPPANAQVVHDRQGQFDYTLGPVLLDANDVGDAKAELDPNSPGAWTITITFRPSGAAKWADVTTENVGKQIAFVVNHEVVSAPSVNAPIVGGATVITGTFTEQEAGDLADDIAGR